MSLHNPRNGGRKLEGELPKVRAAISLDADILEWIKAQGPVSTIINRILKKAKESE